MRASDIDREHVAEWLRTAAGDGRLSFDELDERLEAAYGAKTYAELEPLVADLPGALDRPARPTAYPAAISTTQPQRQPAAMQVGGRALDNVAIAIFGGATRKGRWVVPRKMQNFALFGGIDLDLREAILEDREVTIYANAMFGGIDIIVPEGVAVRTSGAGIFGGFDGVNDDGGAPDGPVIHVTGVAIFGGVDVKRRGPGKKKRAWHRDPPVSGRPEPPPYSLPPGPGH